MSPRRPGALAGAMASAVLIATLAPDARAHEYWLDPLGAVPPAAGDTFAASVRNGQEFVGTSLPYDPARMGTLTLVGPDGRRPVPARLGDFPAVQVGLGESGYYLVAFDTYPKELVYEEMEAFVTFLDYHGQDGILERHRARGLPERDVRESYFRHVKTLVRTRDTGPGDDGTSGDALPDAFAPQGQPLELVAENDPFVDEHLRIRLLADGEPLGGAQVELFERTASGGVTRRTARSDAGGRARFDIGALGDYLVNAVRVTEPGPEARVGGTPPHWQSRWAALTFEKR